MQRLLLAAALLAAAPASAQADPVEHLAAALALTPDQADLVAEVYDDRDPASGWTLAAELVPTLTEAQREALLARPERPVGSRPRGARGARPRGGEGRARPERDPARAAVQRAARDAALGLDADQSARLDAALEGLHGPGALRALRDGGVPDEVAAVLTPEQQELYRAHLALQMHLRRARAAGR